MHEPTSWKGIECCCGVSPLHNLLHSCSTLLLSSSATRGLRLGHPSTSAMPLKDMRQGWPPTSAAVIASARCPLCRASNLPSATVTGCVIPSWVARGARQLLSAGDVACAVPAEELHCSPPANSEHCPDATLVDGGLDQGTCSSSLSVCSLPNMWDLTCRRHCTAFTSSQEACNLQTDMKSQPQL